MQWVAPIIPVALFVTAIAAAAAAENDAGPGTRLIAEARNVPEGCPTIRVVQEKLWGQYYPMVSTDFPNVPGFTCDSWCYEAEVEFLGARPLTEGAVEMRHRVKNQPGVLVVTTISPEPGAVTVEARMAVETDATVFPAAPVGLNLCWQLRHAPAFASAPEPYPEFVKRCFIFTPEGRKFLRDLSRNPIPVQPPDHEYNNPPWVQMYAGTWQPIPPRAEKGWADFSNDRYTTTVIGTVSRDGKHLAAIANDSALNMSQAWHDCMHNNPQWLPADAPVADQRWRLKIYAMENDTDALLKRVGADFPNAKHLAPAETVPAGRP
jgi:hypothetical protein